MERSENSSALGPALFLGLSFYVLVTSSPVEPEYVNPADTMDIDEVTMPVEHSALLVPEPSIFPVSRPIAIPGDAVSQVLANPSTLEQAATVATRVVVPGIALAVSLLQQPPEAEALDVTLAAVDSPIASNAPIAAVRIAIERGLEAQLHDWVVTDGEFINLRSGPGTEFVSLTQLGSGLRGLVLERETDWMRVQFLDDGAAELLVGWMFSGYLAPEE